MYFFAQASSFGTSFSLEFGIPHVNPLLHYWCSDAGHLYINLLLSQRVSAHNTMTLHISTYTHSF